MGNACYGGQQKTRYTWKVVGFSSFLDRPDGLDIVSGVFNAGGYNWNLHMMTCKTEQGRMYISVRLCISVLSDSEVQAKVQAKYNLTIYDQKHSKHIKGTGTSDYTTTLHAGRFHYMIPLEMFTDASLGFLENNTCILGVEILRVLHIPKCNVVHECLSLCEGTTSHVSWKWKMGSSGKFERPHGCSEGFNVGGFKWNILLGGEELEDISIYLKLDYWDAVGLKSGVFVEFTICMKDQIKGEDQKLKCHAVYSPRESSWGWPKFLSCKDLYDPSNGFLVNNTCSIEASITVVGSVNYTRTLFAHGIGSTYSLAKASCSTISMAVRTDEPASSQHSG